MAGSGSPRRGRSPRRRRRRALKETYLKARGLGLALPLDQVSFELDEGDDVGVTFDPRLGDDGTRWRFALLDALPRHLVAVAVEAGAAPLSLRVVSYVPLRGIVSDGGRA